MLRTTLLLTLALGPLAPTSAIAQEVRPIPATPAPATPPPPTAAPVPPAQPVVSVIDAPPATPVAAAAAPAAASPSPAASAPGTTPGKPAPLANSEEPSSSAFQFVAFIMTAFAAAALIVFVRALSRSTTWSLGDAISEEAGSQPSLPPGMRPVMVASASRTIALFGLFMTMSTMLGVGYYIVWALFHGRDLSGLEKITPFFYGSAAIFAPYAVNQMKEAFASLGGAGANQQGGAATPPATAAIAVAATTSSPALPPAAKIAVQPIAIKPAVNA